MMPLGGRRGGPANGHEKADPQVGFLGIGVPGRSPVFDQKLWRRPTAMELKSPLVPYTFLASSTLV
jgi:hypothetical protein